ncbi:MAG: hypothetical protein U9N57_04410, partial [Pseudomonadota bacterium]|nr:hypothetical protein [Pseudomonadota bacterium]
MLFSLTMVIVLVVVASIFFFRAQSEIEQFDKYQQQMMDKQAEVASSEVEELIASIRNRMIAISLDDFFLKDFEQFKSLPSLQEALQLRLKHYFPEMYAFSIADEHGDIMGGDVEQFIGEICQADLKSAANKLKDNQPVHDYQSWIHSKADAYHFDMIFPTHALGKTVVFFMSFKAELIQDAINRKTFVEHDIYLLRKDKPGLIEVAQDGVRNVLTRDVHLMENELSAIAAKKDVPNTRWEIVIVPKAEVRDAFVRNSYLDAFSLFIGFLVFWMALFIFGIYEEYKKGRLMKHL